jgi:hypothetical protein
MDKRKGYVLLLINAGVRNSVSERKKSNNLDESLWVQIHAKGQSFLLCNTYRPQWTDNEYWSRLTHAIELAHQINENIVISGDLNSNLFNVNNNKLVDLMTTFNFRNVIVKPTRLNNLLDPIIISDTMTPLYSDVFEMPSEIYILKYHFPSQI